VQPQQQQRCKQRAVSVCGANRRVCLSSCTLSRVCWLSQSAGALVMLHCMGAEHEKSCGTGAFSCDLCIMLWSAHAFLERF
jgi:hypothetical protein